MKLLFKIFLIVMFGLNSALANNDKKITIEVIENIFFGEQKKYPIINQGKKITKESAEFNKKLRETRKLPSYKKRHETRGIAKCYFDPKGGFDEFRRCEAKIIRAVLSYPEKSKKRRPGDIFFALAAIGSLTGDYETWKNFIKIFDFKPGDKPVPGMVCRESSSGRSLFCKAFKKGTYKKIEKFRKDPSNEKVLGHKLIKYVKNRMMVKNIADRIGTKNYGLLGDMLNDIVAEVRVIDVSPELKLKRSLLSKYVLLLNNLEDKLKKEDHKLVNKQVSKISKHFIKIKNSRSINNEIANIDEAVNIISNVNEIILKSSLEAKDDFNKKNIAISSIYLMKNLVDLIIFTIPEKYYVETKGLSKDLWTDFELERLEIALDKMIKNNAEIKTNRLNNSIEVIKDNYQTIDPIVIINSLEKLGFKNRINKKFNDDLALDIANEAVRDNLDSEIFKDVRKVLQELDRDQINELAKEASESATQIAQEVSNSQQTKSFLDRKIGNHSMKTLIGAHRRGYIDLGIGNR